MFELDKSNNNIILNQNKIKLIKKINIWCLFILHQNFLFILH